MTFKTFSEESGVVFGEWEDEHRSYLVVADSLFEHCKITFMMRENGLCAVGINAEWSDERPGRLAIFTPTYEHARNDCLLHEIEVSDTALLTMMMRQTTTAYILMHMGFTVQLPVAFVAPLRDALALMRERVRVAA